MFNLASPGLQGSDRQPNDDLTDKERLKRQEQKRLKELWIKQSREKARADIEHRKKIEEIKSH